MNPANTHRFCLIRVHQCPSTAHPFLPNEPIIAAKVNQTNHFYLKERTQNFLQVFPGLLRPSGMAIHSPSFAGMLKIPTKKPKMSDYTGFLSGYTVI